MKTMSFLPALLFVLACATATTACREPASTTATTGAPVAREDGDRARAAGQGTASATIYPLGLRLQDQNGATIGVDVFRGHPVIVSMFYGSCPAACPLLVTHIKQIEASLPPDVRARTRVLLVSFDAEHDTPDALRELARAHHVDASRWRFAVGPDDEVRQLAHAIGVTYRKDDDGVFSHNSVLAVLDEAGRIAVRSENPRAELPSLAAALQRLGR